MLNKNSRRLAALTLALLLALCAGCGSSAEPAADTPAPSQAAAAPKPAPSPTPDAEQAPVPEPASSPTDIGGSAAAVLPQLENPVKREAPETLQLLSLGAAYTLTNAESQTLTCDGSGISGGMAFTRQQLSDAGNIVSVTIPYSSRLTFETSDVSGDWGFELLATSCPWCHFVAKGSGKLDGLAFDPGKGLSVRTEPGAELELTLPVPDSALGENGWICLHLTAGENEVSLACSGSTVSFSGLKADANAAVSLDYGGFVSGKGLDVALTGGSGAMDLSNIVGGTVSVS